MLGDKAIESSLVQPKTIHTLYLLPGWEGYSWAIVYDYPLPPEGSRFQGRMEGRKSTNSEGYVIELIAVVGVAEGDRIVGLAGPNYHSWEGSEVIDGREGSAIHPEPGGGEDR